MRTSYCHLLVSYRLPRFVEVDLTNAAINFKSSRTLVFRKSKPRPVSDVLHREVPIGIQASIPNSATSALDPDGGGHAVDGVKRRSDYVTARMETEAEGPSQVSL